MGWGWGSVVTPKHAGARLRGNAYKLVCLHRCREMDRHNSIPLADSRQPPSTKQAGQQTDICMLTCSPVFKHAHSHVIHKHTQTHKHTMEAAALLSRASLTQRACDLQTTTKRQTRFLRIPDTHRTVASLQRSCGHRQFQFIAYEAEFTLTKVANSFFSKKHTHKVLVRLWYLDEIDKSIHESHEAASMMSVSCT